MHFQLSDEHRMIKELVEKFVKDELLPLEARVMAREAAGAAYNLGLKIRRHSMRRPGR
jgi:hypothetical protein